MSLYEETLESDALLSAISKNVDALKRSGAYPVFLEIMARKTTPVQGDRFPLQSAGLRSAYANGYFEALQDVFYFSERFTKETKIAPKMNFGAAETLLATGEITADEYTELTGEPAPATAAR